MRRTLNLALFAVVLLLASMSHVSTALSAPQIAMLQALYNSTNGAAWTNRKGWDTPFAEWKDPCAVKDPYPSSLYGVYCSNGEVAHFIMENNNLNGAFPANFSLAFPQLLSMQFPNNPLLGGTIPDVVAGAPLQYVLLQQCQFTGTIPASLFTPSLVQLEVELNKLTGGLPVEVGNSPFLRILKVGENNLNIGDVPASIVQCSDMEMLNLMQSGVTSLPLNISQLGGLQHLNLQGNHLSGSIPTGWCSLTNLQYVMLQNNAGLSGTIPACIASWSNLIQLNIQNTNMEGTIPAFIFESFRNLQGLYLAGSRFSGQIPDMFDRLPFLQNVAFNGDGSRGGASYSGTFPTTLFQVQTLLTVSIQYTAITGPVPDFSGTPEISTIVLSSNPNMAMTFPSALLTSMWASPMVTAGSRGLLISDMPMTGTIPQIFGDVMDLSTSGGFGFSGTDITGYIPNTTLHWVPLASQQGLLANCKKLLYPIKPWMAHLVTVRDGEVPYTGLQFTLSGLLNSNAGVAYSMAGGDTITISGVGFVDIASRFNCAFCVSGNQTACESDVNQMTTAQRQANFVFSPATVNVLNASMSCVTPSLPTNGNIMVYIFYVGSAYGPGTEYYQVSSSFVSVPFFNPRPTLVSLMPDHGRLEGCSQLFAVGSGFLNAPSVVLLIDDAIQSVNATVVNDSFVTFYLPLANATNINSKYNYETYSNLTVDVFAIGISGPRGHSNATYYFSTTCSSPLVLCDNGFEDPEGCPTPLCRCFSAGQCSDSNATLGYQCHCLEGHAGDSCEACSGGHFGLQCAACECRHGACDDGIHGTGRCDCTSGYFGEDCQISKYGLGFGVVIGGIVALLTALFLRKKYHENRDCGDDGYEQLNAVGDRYKKV